MTLLGGPAWPPVRHPFEVAGIVAFWTIGLLGLISHGSESLDALLSPTVLIAWHSTLVVATTLGGFAVLSAKRAPLLSLLCERLFLVGLIGLVPVYVAGLFVAAIPADRIGIIVPVVYFGVYWLAAIGRLWQVQRYIAWRKERATTALEQLGSEPT